MAGLIVCQSLPLASGVAGEPLLAPRWVGGESLVPHCRWGIHGGLQFAVHPAGFDGGTGGPRGLIRVGYPVLAGGRHDLINFIAIEPVVGGRRGFSEMERSPTDGEAGLLIRPQGPVRLTRLEAGVEELEVVLVVERFANGAEVEARVSQRSDTPEELRFKVRALPGSARLDYCILTATMGNYARVRRLWLKDGPVDSRSLYSDFRGSGFAPHTRYASGRLKVDGQGDLIVAVTTDEADPASVRPFPASGRWHYGGVKVTQFWKKKRGAWRDGLEAAVNARYTYWMTHRPIPGGVSFENFELREPFHEGQEFVFGITLKTPEQLGWVMPAERGDPSTAP